MPSNEQSPGRGRRGRGKPKAAGAKGRSPAFVVYARIGLEFEKAVAAYVAAQKFKPTLTEFVELAFATLLAQEGFWPPKPRPE